MTNDLSHVRKIIVACDAGMGSSAMGAGVLRKKIQDAGLSQISVTNSAINNLPPDVDLVITHRDLTERAMRQVPQAQHISLTNFLDSGLYTSLTERLVAAQRHTANEEKVKDSLKDSFDDSSANLFKLGAENIFLGRKAAVPGMISWSRSSKFRITRGSWLASSIRSLLLLHVMVTRCLLAL